MVAESMNIVVDVEALPLHIAKIFMKKIWHVSKILEAEK